MYRAITAVALDRGIAIADEASVTRLAEKVQIDVLPPTAQDGRQYTILADGADITWRIREADVNREVSPVSAYPGVRAALTMQQRRIGYAGSVVMVGRDIGTVVLPEAEVKVYLDASLEERARRRHQETLQRGQPSDYSAMIIELRRRDEIDSHRATAPLRAADDARIIDSTHLCADQVTDLIETVVREFLEQQ